MGTRLSPLVPLGGGGGADFGGAEAGAGEEGAEDLGAGALDDDGDGGGDEGALALGAAALGDSAGLGAVVSILSNSAPTSTVSPSLTRIAVTFPL